MIDLPRLTICTLNCAGICNDDTRRALFLSFDSDTFDPFRFAFVAGDWNCCPDPSQDRSSLSDHTRNDHWPLLAPSLTSFFDGALAGATEPYHTFFHTGINCSARLDHVFVSSQLASC